MTIKPKAQKAKTDWKDEAGNTVPWTTIKPVEKVNEKITLRLATKALRISEQLKSFKEFLQAEVDMAIKAFHDSYEGNRKAFKGNYTIFNFDQTIKVEVSVSTPIKFDDLLILEAKEELDLFLQDGVSAKNAAIKQMILDAFETSRGKLDVKKILGLKRYADRIDDKHYTKAMSLIDQAQRRPDSKKYFRVAIKDDMNKWNYIPLALSDV